MKFKELGTILNLSNGVCDIPVYRNFQTFQTFQTLQTRNNERGMYILTHHFLNPYSPFLFLLIYFQPSSILLQPPEMY